jgi:endonuclease YncB( thermonuclease family)
MPIARRVATGLAAIVLLIGATWGVLHRLWSPTDVDRYSVVDGDTLARQPRRCLLANLGIGCLSERLRLYGVDAFESKQTCRDEKNATWPCGAVATARLRELVEHTDFACYVDHEVIDRYAREFAVCAAGGQDVGATLVREGLAFAYGRGSHYLPIEAEAKRERRGAWAGNFVRPQYFHQGAVE